MALRTDATSSAQSDEAKARAIQQQNATLIWAINQGYESIVKTMLATPGTDILAHDPNDTLKTPPLVLAATLGRDNIVSILLEHCNPNVVDIYNETALLVAIYKKQTTSAQLLLKHPLTDVNITSTNGCIALMIAVGYAQTEIALELLKHEHIDLKKIAWTNVTVFAFLKTVQSTPIFDALLTACAKWLLKADKDEVSIIILNELKPYKEKLFAALMQLSATEQLNAVKQIIEAKETTALGKVFWHNKSANSIAKGTMAIVQAKYFELIKTEQKASQLDAPAKENEPFQYKPESLIPIFEYKFECEEKPNENLLQQFSQIPTESLTPTILERLKKYKTELLEAINALGIDKELVMLEQIFDETKSDKKNDRTALGNVFWAGHPNLSEGRLGAAYKRYCELKHPNAIFEKPLQPSKASQLFGNLFGKGKEPELKVTLDAGKTASDTSSAFMQFNNL